MKPTDTFEQYPFLRGGGQMGDITRRFDWSKTALGTPDGWPFSLRASVSNMLRASLPMLVLWGEEHSCFYNDAVIPSLDPEKHPAIGAPASQLWAEGWTFIGPRLAGVLTTGQPVSFQNAPVPIYRNGNREDVYWTFFYSQILNDEGDPGGVLVSCLETTQAVQSRQALVRTQKQFQNLVRSAPVAIALFEGPQFVIELANERMLEHWDRNRQQVMHKPLFEALPETSGQGFEELLMGVYTTGERFTAKELTVTLERNGQLVPTYIDFVYEPFRQPDGTITGVLVICTEITEQVLARRKVEESEARFRSLIQEAPVAMLVYEGPDQVLVEANQEMLEIFGRGDAILGKPVLEAVPELKNTDLPANYQRVLATGEPYHHPAERVLLIKNGQSYSAYYNYTYKPLHDEQGTVYGVIGTAVDVTTQILAQQALKANEVTLQSIIDLAELGLYTIDMRTNQLIKSPRVAEWYGLPEQTDVATSVSAIQESDRERVRQVLIDSLRPGSTGFYQAEYTVTSPKTGIQRILRTSGQVRWDSSGQPIRVDGTVRDITGQRELQVALEQQMQQRTEELATANEELAAMNEELAAMNEELTASNEELLTSNEKTEAVNEELADLNNNLSRSNDNLEKFAYVASHDLQEPLRKIQQFGDILKTQHAGQLGEGVLYLERMQSAAGRMSTLIKDLLEYSRIATQRDINAPVSLDSLVANVLTTLELTIQETGAQIRVEPLPTIWGDSSQLGQLFQNLISNALKFRRLNTVPTIQVRSQTMEAADLPAGLKPSRLAAQYYRIDVVDNGIGFDEKYLDRIFQVFQRLHGKNEFVGTGIGLAICEKVVANHGGAITAASQPGQGATFSVYLPAEARQRYLTNYAD